MWVGVGVSLGGSRCSLSTSPRPGSLVRSAARYLGLQGAQGSGVGNPQAASPGLGREGAERTSSDPPNTGMRSGESFRRPGAYLGPGWRRGGAQSGVWATALRGPR
jgi:hypothetical protein